eukprot:CAMPEP_0204907476 /NCGR_PEP_ID=MMETSP1397-20131031/6621_1 /ASSEMBLY_ACC=CAM_ASM_000891 /TAXON_ID=49980 /ORGANISM="Climacostomum Climacostomum virens, Strain Stock W-24" /LENGTH=176 /DNA_ID=CAMNT_0052076645 /DNA_START=90 /DNA_END=617 /DNA_ORIENTATION=-
MSARRGIELRVIQDRDIKQCIVHHAYKGYVSFTNNNRLYRQGPWDSVAVVYSAEGELKALTKYYDNYEELTLADLLSRPYYAEVGVRKIEVKGDSLQKRTDLYLEEIHEMQDTLAKSWPKPKRDSFRDSVDIVMNFWCRTGLGNIEKMKVSLRQTTEDLNSQKPKMLSFDLAAYSD